MRSSCMFLQIMVILFITVTNIGAQTQPLTNKKLLRPFNNTISALFVFGDSTVDSGNNNYISTVIKCNFPPYGRDFLNHIPSGRFTNGRLVTDFAASYIGLKELVPPYLDPKLSLEELMTGVSFASAGSGFDPITAQLSGVIPLQKQLEYFKEYKRRLENAIGEERTKLLISKAAFLVSAGTNDFLVNYFSTQFRSKTYTVSAYQHFLLQHVQQFVQDLLAEGARLIGVVGVPPLGCLPVLITLNHHSPLQHRECIDSYSAVGKEYNWHLQNLLKIMRIHGTQLVYGDIYNSLNDMIQNPNHYGFDDVSSGCCGSGLFEAAIFCNPNSIVCNNASEYIFWDAVHPTQATYYNLFRSLRPIIDSVIKQ
ncbi:GDSL esterase/lipase At5g45960-like isoform X1 [Nicotiana sylvestris]|uniref:GDSL esterase/lipase At5g45960-like isoform X1 n=1 Tax=Nicotiana sylvestris TaxID=4096 RepID=A0A1U7WCK2_NICSY|nr:PREDICTED: GDSL esterase/lipase At5g45960-like isoform X1 [Nicotiana sylvestris]